jgi:hypothetical protein
MNLTTTLKVSRLSLVPVVLFFLGGVVPASAVEEQLEGGWVRFALTGRAYAVAEWGASSVLESDHYWEMSRYDPGKALDGDPATAWVEGAPGPGIGETIVLGFSHYPEALGFINGFARNRNLFVRNHRVRSLNVQLYTALNVDGFATESVTFYDALPAGPARRVSLADEMEAQRVLLPVSPRSAQVAMEAFRASGAVAGWTFPQAVTMGVDGGMGMPLQFRYILRLEIAEVYRGTTWEDTCIAEIWPDFGEIEDVAVSDDMRRLVLTTPDGRLVPGYADFDSVLTLVDLSRDARWAIVIREPAYLETGQGRVSSEYAVIHTPTGRDMTAGILSEAGISGEASFLPFGFEEEGGVTWLLFDDPAGNERRAPCGPLYRVAGNE